MLPAFPPPETTKQPDETGFGGFDTIPPGIFPKLSGTDSDEREFQWMYESRDIIGYLEGRFVVG
jgi:hypothetical protein